MPSKKKPVAKKKTAAKKSPVRAKAKAASKPAAKKVAKPASKPAAPQSPPYRVVMPHLVCAGAAQAIEFYKQAFGAVEHSRMDGPPGKLMHAMVGIGPTMVMLVDEFPEWGSLAPTSLKGSPVTLHFYVEDVDAAVAKAVSAGATLKMPVQDMFWGDRYAVLTDPFGHNWSLATHIRDVSPAEMAEAAKQMCQ